MQVRFEGTLDARHNKTHIPHTFNVPPGTQVVTIRFDQTEQTSAMVVPQVSLTLFDPNGARGARHNNADQNIRLTAWTATPGYVPGNLIAGTWTAWIDVHRLLEPDTVQYTLDIEVSEETPDEVPQAWTKGSTAPRGRGWYRGDLHGHTLHSDASWDVPEFVQYARHYGLDFVTLTDHNTVSPLPEHDHYSADDLLTMGGMELTTYDGHALALGVRAWQEWRVGLDGATMPMLAERAMSGGALFVIAHPMSIGDPWCTGCAWGYADMMPGSARCVEIWNGEWAGTSNNEAALGLWYGWLNEGYRMAVTAGTDIHGPLYDAAPGFNVVYAEALSERAILSAIRAGHLYLSRGARLDLTAQGENGSAGMMGDVVSGNTVKLAARWADAAEGDALRLIVGGEVREVVPVGASGEREWTLNAETRWATVELRGADGTMRAIANPIFMGSEADWR